MPNFFFHNQGEKRSFELSSPPVKMSWETDLNLIQKFVLNVEKEVGTVLEINFVTGPLYQVISQDPRVIHQSEWDNIIYDEGVLGTIICDYHLQPSFKGEKIAFLRTKAKTREVAHELFHFLNPIPDTFVDIREARKLGQLPSYRRLLECFSYFFLGELMADYLSTMNLIKNQYLFRDDDYPKMAQDAVQIALNCIHFFERIPQIIKLDPTPHAFCFIMYFFFNALRNHLMYFFGFWRGFKEGGRSTNKFETEWRKYTEYIEHHWQDLDAGLTNVKFSFLDFVISLKKLLVEKSLPPLLQTLIHDVNPLCDAYLRKDLYPLLFPHSPDFTIFFAT